MKKIITFIIALAFIPSLLSAKGDASLWKKVEQAQKKDLPQTQLKLLNEIIAKAQKEQRYGSLLKAEVMQMDIKYRINSDSIKAGIAQLTRKAQQAKKIDTALFSVYCALINKAYKQYYIEGLNPKDSIEKYKALAISNMARLEVEDASGYEPLVVKGIDSDIFSNNLLHVIAIETDNYKALNQYYSKKNKRIPACISAALMMQNERYDYDTKSKKSKYLQSLDSLIAQYKDLTEAGELAITRFQYINNAEDVSAENKIKYIDYALSRWGAWRRMNTLRNARKQLTLPSFHVVLSNERLLPNKDFIFPIVSLCNIQQLTFKIWKTKLQGDNNIDINDTKEYNKLKNIVSSNPVFEQTKRFIGLPDYKVVKDSFNINNGLDAGIYLVEIASDVKGVATERALINVSDIYLLQQKLEEKDKLINNKYRLVALSATTGEPLPNAKIRATYTFYNSGEKMVDTYSCSENGELELPIKNNSHLEFFVYTNNDSFAKPFEANGYFAKAQKQITYNEEVIFTDRSIYRPRQTVQVSVLSYKNIQNRDLAVVPNKKIKIKLLDANYKVLKEQEVETDSYGSASTNFIIPQNSLNGTFRIKTDRSSYSFRVEEYKRPTFSVEFNKIDKKYADGDTIIVKGLARSFAGSPLNNARVAYTITRSPRYFGWTYRNEHNAQVLKTDTIVTKDNGEFYVPVHLVVPEIENEKAPRFYSFDISADVTNLAGETQNAQMSLPLGNKPTMFFVELPSKAEKNDSLLINLKYTNSAGEPIVAKAKYKLFNNDQWKTINTNTNYKLSVKDVPQGKNNFIAICQNDTINQQLLVYDINSTKVPVDTLNWFNVTSNKFDSKGTPIRVQIGTSAPQQHVVYTIASQDEIIEKGTLELKNEVLNQTFSYKPEYKNGIVISYAWVKNGVQYSHNASITNELPNKELTVKWKTFRNRLVPGQKEEWSLSVTRANGKINKAQILMSMYDKSLDVLSPYNFNFNPTRYYALPYLAWSKDYKQNVSLYGEQTINLLDSRDLQFSHFFENIYPLGAEYAISPIMRKGALLGATTRSLAYNNAVATTNAVATQAMIENDEQNTNNSVDNSNNSKTNTKGVKLRNNFNETALFYPNVETDDNGVATFKFTLPEATTTWKFMALAHDKEMNYGSITSEVIAQKEVMVQPNVPRFIRQGDNVWLDAQIANLSAKSISGIATLEIVDPETNRVLITRTQNYAIANNKATAVSFNIKAQNLPAIIIARYYAKGKSHSDGEEHYIPVLSNMQWVTNAMAFIQKTKGNKTINSKQLFPEDAKKKQITIEYTNQPAWLAILNLPKIAQPQNNNAIDLASAIYANAVAKQILTASPHIKTIIDLWRNENSNNSTLASALQQNSELKNIALKETPWILEAENESEQKQMLINYFDNSQLEQRTQSQIKALTQLQGADGGFAWFEGMTSNSYITTSVVELLAQLKQNNWLNSNLQNVLNKAFAFVEKDMKQLVEKDKNKKNNELFINNINEVGAHYLYVHSLKNNKGNITKGSDDEYLANKILKDVKQLTIYGKAKMAYVLKKNQKENANYLELANQMISNIKQYSTYNENSGRFFNSYNAPYWWVDGQVPTQTAVIEAFNFVEPNDTETIEQLQQWLLQNYRNKKLESAINSVNAANVIINNNKNVVSGTNKNDLPIIKINNKQIEDNNYSAALGYTKVSQQANNIESIDIEKQNNGLSWGAIYAQFEQKLTNVAGANSGLTINRTITKNGLPIKNGQLKVGDKVVVTITINADKDYSFVQVNDKRMACLEPSTQTSGYKQGAYCNVKDNETNYFFDYLNKGLHTLQTTYYVDKAGTFTSGICTVQCAYAPEFMARTTALTVNVAK